MFRRYQMLLMSTSLMMCAIGCQNVKTVHAETNCLLETCNQPERNPHPEAQSVDGTALQSCSKQPLTGFFRDSYCRTDAQDRGVHVVCAEMTDAFLEYTKSMGNDLSTPAPRYGFAGLKAGDRWCLCAARWYEAYLADRAPPVFLDGTDQKALEIVPKSVLESQAL